MSQQSEDERLAAVLGMLCTSNTEIIRTGEKLLKPLSKKASSLLLFINQLRMNQDSGIRHHAALLLKKRMASHYPKLNATSQTMIRDNILPMLRAEPIKVVCVSIAGAVSTLAQCIFSEKKQWPELFAAISQMGQSEREQDRFLCYSLLDQLSEHVADDLHPHTSTLANMFVVGCQDPSPQVAVAAMSAVTSFIVAIGATDEVLMLKPVLTPLLTRLTQFANSGDTPDFTDGLQIVNQCVRLEQPLINEHIPAIVPFITSILQNENVEKTMRAAAGQTLMDIVEGRPKLISKTNLVAPVLSSIAGILANAEYAAGSLFSFGGRIDFDGNDQDDDDDEEEEDIYKLAQCCLDTMAINIPSKYFLEPALQLCAQGMQSPQVGYRRAGCAMLGIISEGCCDSLRPILNQIIPPLLALVADSDDLVREIACFSLGQYSEHCQPEILHFHEQILPVVCQSLQDPKQSVAGTGCYVIEMFVENLSNITLRPFLEPILSRLGGFLQNPKPIIIEMGLAAIGATAVAAEIDFLPYAESICTFLRPLLFTTEPQYLEVRGRALECLGHVAVAIGETHFIKYFEVGMQSAVQAFSLDHTDLKEHSYVYFANASKVMKMAFAPYVEGLMPNLIEMISQTELVFGDDDDEEEEAGAEATAEDSFDDDFSDADVRINGLEGFINNKTAAITACGAIAENVGAALMPYLDQVINSLLQPGVGAVYSYHALIRGEVFEMMPSFLKCIRIGNGLTENCKRGEMLALPQPVAEMCRVAMQVCLAAMEDDEEKKPVAQAVDAISNILEQVGGVALTATDDKGKVIGQRLLTDILEFLKEKSACQTARAEIEDDADDEDHDYLVMDSVTDLIGILAKTLGTSFLQHFDLLLAPLMKFTRPSRVHSDRSMAIGCLGEVVQFTGPDCMKYASTIMQLLPEGLADPHEAVRRNCAFTLGVFVASTGTALVPHYMQFLQWLHPLCSRSSDKQGADSGGADIDNALSAVAHMIRGSPASVPLNMVLPAMTSALPLRVDELEGTNVYGCFLELLSNMNPTAVELAPVLLASFAAELNSILNTSTPELKQHIATSLKSLFASPSHSAMMNQALNGMTNEDMKRILVDVLSK